MPRNQQPDKSLEWGKLIESALTMPGKLSDTYNRFHEYSALNQAYLYMQGVEPQPVATYKRWQKVGRQVLKGSRAKEIIRPVIIEKKDEAGAVAEKKVLFKAVRCIFTYAETEGDELPPVDIPSWDLEKALDTLNVKQVPYRIMDGNTQGYSLGREYALNPVAVNPIKTTAHEIAHIVSGHTTPEGVAEYQTHRGVMEFVAEGSAFLALKELDMLTDEQASESRAYIRGWLEGERPPDSAIRQVFSTTDAILRAGRLAIDAENAIIET